MRDKRAIIIKDPRLRKVRDNLRRIFLEAVSLKWRELNNKRKQLKFNIDGTRRVLDDFSSDELQDYRAYQTQQNELRKLADKSICKCNACGKADRDMVYNKAYNAWYCTECYGLERTSAQERAKVPQKDSKSCEEKAIEEHSKTFL